jgi:hypothetical protein
MVILCLCDRPETFAINTILSNRKGKTPLLDRLFYPQIIIMIVEIERRISHERQ